MGRCWGVATASSKPGFGRIRFSVTSAYVQNLRTIRYRSTSMRLAAEIRVTPGETVVTYSHAAFTIRQHMFAARGGNNPATGVAVFFEVEAVRPLEITFSFTPEMLHMWPAPNFGRPNGEWVPQGKQGAYVLHTDDPDFSAIVAMPNTRAGHHGALPRASADLSAWS